VGGTAKAYLREMWEKSKVDKVTVTFKSTLSNNDMDSFRDDFERNIGAFMENMYFATEFASHIKGNIKDSTGKLIPEATISLEMQVFSPLLIGQGTTNNWAHLMTESGVFEQTQTAVYNVTGGVFDWSVTPSKQPNNRIGNNATQFPDLGYDITVSAPGKVDQCINVKVPRYQMTVDLGDIVLDNDKKHWWEELRESGCNVGYGYISLLLFGLVLSTVCRKRKF
jgi:hypothetical protein